MTETFDIAGYARISVDDELDQKNISIENQKSIIEDYVKHYFPGSRLTAIVQAMIGEEYKPVSHDVNFLLSVYSRKSRKALTVSCANHKYLRGYIAEICHRIVTGKSYEVDYKKVKNA